MKTHHFLITSAAAVAVMSGVGLAVAQNTSTTPLTTPSTSSGNTTMEPATTRDTTTPMTNPASNSGSSTRTNSDGSMTNNSMSTNTDRSAGSTDGMPPRNGMGTQRTPRADRN